MITAEEAQIDIKEFFKKYSPDVEKEIEKYIPRKATKAWIEEGLGETFFALDVDAYQKGVNDPIWNLLDRGGKRFRPLLVCVTSEAVGGKWEEGLKLAPIIELIHEGTLMQDDVEDDSKLRRGAPCIHKLYGVDTAVNTGTIMYFWPMVKILNDDFNLGEKKKLQIYDLYIKELLRVCSGQAWDIAWHNGGFTPNESQYLNMCLSKTGVLTKFACQLGAIVGNGTPKQVEALGNYGQILGVAFQIADDILEVTGEEFKKLKGGNGGDIHEGKRTLIIIRALEQSSPKDKKRLLEILDSHTSNKKDIEEAIAIIKKTDAITYAQKKAGELVITAWKEVDKVLPASNAKTLLRRVTEYLIQRKI